MARVLHCNASVFRACWLRALRGLPALAQGLAAVSSDDVALS